VLQALIEIGSGDLVDVVPERQLDARLLDPGDVFRAPDHEVVHVEGAEERREDVLLGDVVGLVLHQARVVRPVDEARVGLSGFHPRPADVDDLLDQSLGRGARRQHGQDVFRRQVRESHAAHDGQAFLIDGIQHSGIAPSHFEDLATAHEQHLGGSIARPPNSRPRRTIDQARGLSCKSRLSPAPAWLGAPAAAATSARSSAVVSSVSASVSALRSEAATAAGSDRTRGGGGRWQPR
jgi:hypothetical protein